MLVFRVFFLRNRLMELSEFVLNWHIRIWFIIHSASVTQSDVLGWQTRYFFAQTRAEGGVSVRAYGKSWDYNVYDCQYCLYWKGRKKGCVYPDGCCCPIDQRDAFQFRDDEDKENTAPVSECRNCPYGRDSPCIGWCTKEVMRAVGLLKERDDPDV